MQSNRPHLEHVAKEEMNHIFATVPKAQEFHTGQWTDLDYYRRHLVETVLRIRLNNEVDAYGLYKIGSKDNKLAQILAQYLAEEYGHENLFMRDIERFGLKKTEVDAIPTFAATDQLIGYLYFSINRDGPLPTLIWNWFVEWYSDNYNKTITQKAAETFGSEKVKGSLGHIQYDESHDHDDLMWGAVQQAIDGWGDLAKAESYLRNFVRLIGRYFEELHSHTADRTEQAAA
jgi:heme oxygenase-like protein